MLAQVVPLKIQLLKLLCSKEAQGCSDRELAACMKMRWSQLYIVMESLRNNLLVIEKSVVLASDHDISIRYVITDLGRALIREGGYELE
ncbi:MAG: hypothetical protein HQK50_07585 [Oligoflexia bacterium]|nr:hypothetical protein [Oligoflexia bacterium]MBF0365417.1 hypothetical protein [Oligoflexia bacterium]